MNNEFQAMQASADSFDQQNDRIGNDSVRQSLDESQSAWAQYRDANCGINGLV
jgi:uncharacterized protein YecT (DUF1311 family)